MAEQSNGFGVYSPSNAEGSDESRLPHEPATAPSCATQGKPGCINFISPTLLVCLHLRRLGLHLESESLISLGRIVLTFSFR